MDCSQGRDEKTLRNLHGRFSIFSNQIFMRALEQNFSLEIFRFLKSELLPLIAQNIQQGTGSDLLVVITPAQLSLRRIYCR